MYSGERRIILERAVSGTVAIVRAIPAGDQFATFYLRAVLMLALEPLVNDPRWAPYSSARVFLRVYVDDITVQAVGNPASVLEQLPLLANTMVQRMEGDVSVYLPV